MTSIHMICDTPVLHGKCRQVRLYREVAELLRHSDIPITMRYAHLAPENVRAAAAVLDRFDWIASRFGHVTPQHHLREVV